MDIEEVINTVRESCELKDELKRTERDLQIEKNKNGKLVFLARQLKDSLDHFIGKACEAQSGHGFTRIDDPDVKLSKRTRRLLIEDGLVYLNAIEKKSKGDLLRIPSFGKHSFNELKDVMASYNLEIGSRL